MAKLKRKHYIELIICLLVCVIPIISSVTHVQHFTYAESLFVDDNNNVIAKREMHNGVENIEISEILEETSGGDLYLRHYDIPNGDTVVSGSLHGITEEPVVLQALHIVGDASIHYYDNGEFETFPLEEGEYDPSLLFIDSKEFDVACYTPKQYKFLENDSLEYLPEFDGYLKVKKAEDGFDIELVTDIVAENCCSDFMIVYSNADFMNWATNEVDPAWIQLTMDGDNRWTYTGFYRKAASNYYPTGENVYSRCQACYLGASFVNANPRYRVMDDMLFCIIDTMSLQQNELGFFPSESRSDWLYEDFNIPAGYYDTRFNSDLMEIFIKSYELYMNSSAYKAMEKYADFFVNMVEQCGRSDKKGGIWVPDYWSEEADFTKVNTSLNHQLSEISVLYKMSDILHRIDLARLADKMLKAIENTGYSWTKPDNDLHYCIYPDGSFGKDDYLELTYNDMFKLQKVLEEKKGYRNEVLDNLMECKLRWMKLHGAKDYLQ